MRPTQVLGGHISPSNDSENKRQNKKAYREKSINDARDEFHEPLQGDLVALARLVPNLYLAFPRFISRPLRRNRIFLAEN
jgi:hypothetical protein